jgi:hypothetical protein
MTERERVEQRIIEVLATNANALALSDQRFHPNGLFNQLAKTEEKRWIVARSPLFHPAQLRLTVLQHGEATKFARAETEAQAVMPEGGSVFKLERAESV